MERFKRIIKAAEKRNRQERCNRFFIMTSTKNGSWVEVGVYDGKTKKYVLAHTSVWHLDESLTEMEQMVGLK